MYPPENMPSNSYPRGSAGAAPPQGNTIDSVVSRLQTLASAINQMTNRLEQVANSTMGSQPSATSNTKIDHPPTSLQEYLSYLEDRVTLLDQQVMRFF